VLEEIGAEALWEGDRPESLDGRDFVVWSPGIPDRHPLAAAARTRSVPVLSELELGFLAAHAPLVGVTGTNGKSTTTDLVGALLRGAGREVEVCGNIGRPICDVAESVGPAGLLVVEVSSFQLETVSRLKPFVAVWLNLGPDHLDRHGDLDTYGALKQRLFARQDEGDYAVWNADDPEVTRRRVGVAQPLEFSSQRKVDEGAWAQDGEITLGRRGGVERLMPARELGIPGPHNLMNALAALAATLPLEIAPDTLREGLRRGRGSCCSPPVARRSTCSATTRTGAGRSRPRSGGSSPRRRAREPRRPLAPHAAAGAHRARRGDGLLVQHHPRDHPLSGPESLPVQAAHPRRGGGDRDGRLLPPPAPPARAALALAAGRRGGPAPGGGGDRAGGQGGHALARRGALLDPAHRPRPPLRGGVPGLVAQAPPAGRARVRPRPPSPAPHGGGALGADPAAAQPEQRRAA